MVDNDTVAAADQSRPPGQGGTVLCGREKLTD